MTFPRLEAWDPRLEAVNFLALPARGRTLLCSITREALERHFGADAGAAPLACFCRHRPEIEAIAQRLIDSQRFESDGSVVICAADELDDADS